MANLPNFSFTKQSDVFDTATLLLGTAVHIQGGTRTDGTFYEGNGIVIAVSPLEITVYLYELHKLAFQTVVIPVADFMAGVTVVQVLTIEDGTGSELTGAQPSDITPPAEVTNLEVIATHDTATLTYELPTDTDFSYAQIFQDDVLVADNVLDTTYTVTGLSELTHYVYTVKTVDVNGNVSVGDFYDVVTSETPDTTPPGEVTNLLVTNTSTTTVELVYSLPSDEDFSYAQIVDENGVVIADNIVESSYIITDLLPATIYNYVIKTVDLSNNVSSGVPFTFTTEA